MQTAQQQQVQAQSQGNFNKVFQLNKQLILTARRLETGPLENYTHMATLIHKMNLLLLEFDSMAQMKTALTLIYSKKLLSTLVDFSMNTEHFAHFGIRFLEILSLQFPVEIAQNSEIISVVSGLLRTNDYETCVQCLSFVAVLAQSTALTPDKSNFEAKSGFPPNQSVSVVLNPKLLTLILKICAKKPEIEYVHYALQIVELAMRETQLRHLVIKEPLRDVKELNQGISEELGSNTYTWLYFLKLHCEKAQEFQGIQKLHTRILRQRRELETWAQAKQK